LDVAKLTNIEGRARGSTWRLLMRFVATKTAEQLDLQALHRVGSRLIGERTAIVNKIRALLLDRGIAVSKGLHRRRRRCRASSPRKHIALAASPSNGQNLDPGSTSDCEGSSGQGTGVA
jgi:transposase